MKHGILPRVASLVVTFLVLSACAVQAQQASRLDKFQARLAERFSAADQDHDGWVTRAEAEAGMPFVARNFDQIDAKGQGRLSQDDILAFLASRAAQRQQR